MKITKRNLIKGGFFATLASLIAPASATSVTASSSKSKKVMNPYDAALHVFTETVGIGDEIILPPEFKNAKVSLARAKQVPSRDPFREAWLIYSEVVFETGDSVQKTRALSVETITSKKVCDLVNKRNASNAQKYDVQKSFKHYSSWTSLITVKNYAKGEVFYGNTSIGALIVFPEDTISENPQTAILSHFLALTSGRA